MNHANKSDQDLAILTTEKDMVRILSFSDHQLFKVVPIFYIPIDISIDDQFDFKASLLKRIEEKKNNTEFVILNVRRGILIFVGILLVLEGFSQVDRGAKKLQSDSSRKRILGDTIEASYTALTTKFIYEKNIKFNDVVFYHPDTVPDNFHQFTDLEKNQNFVQNLGNIGTAFKPLFFEPKNEIGRTTGFQSFDEFHTGPDDIKYFDTRSPFTGCYRRIWW